MIIKKADFLTSVVDINSLKQDTINEIAIAGKSNVGKSSFINFITNNSKLARTSKEPGLTKHINYFKINNGEFYFVDLPGYGYARVSFSEKEKWSVLIEGYFQVSRNLKNVFLLVDIRHTPNDNDIQLVNYLNHYGIPYTIIATKADKIAKTKLLQYKKEIASTLRIGVDNIIVTSSLYRTGLNDVLNRIEQVVNPSEPSQE